MIRFNSKNIIDGLIQYIVIIMILYISGDTAWGSTNPGIRNRIIVLMTMFSIIYYMFVKKWISYSYAKTYAVCAVCVAISMIANLDFSGFSMLMVMFVGMLISETMPFDGFIRKYANIILVVSIASIIGLVIQQVRPSLLDSLPILKGGGTDALANMIVTAVPRDYTDRAIRCYGIFREPSMFAIYLIVGLLFELFYKDKKSCIRIAIMAVSLALTQSMTGFIAFAVMLAAYFLYSEMKGAEYIIWFFALIIGVIYLIHGTVEGYGTVLDYIFIRMRRVGSSSHSINSRIASITVNIYTWLTHPFTGAGAIKSQELFDINLKKLGYSEGLTPTNMITYSLASFGIVFTGFFIHGLERFSQNMCHKKNVFLVLIVICCCLCGQIMHYSVFPFLMMFYGCNKFQSKKGGIYRGYKENDENTMALQ